MTAARRPAPRFVAEALDIAVAVVIADWTLAESFSDLLGAPAA